MHRNYIYNMQQKSQVRRECIAKCLIASRVVFVWCKCLFKTVIISLEKWFAIWLFEMWTGIYIVCCIDFMKLIIVIRQMKFNMHDVSVKLLFFFGAYVTDTTCMSNALTELNISFCWLNIRREKNPVIFKDHG